MWVLCALAGLASIPDTSLGAGAKLLFGQGAPERPERFFEFEYRLVLPADEASGERIDLFVPIAVDSHAQKILDFEIESEWSGRIEHEAEYGNRYWHAVVPANRSQPSTVRIRYIVRRREQRAGDVPGEAASAARFLGANDRVAVAHPVLDPILAEIREASPGGDPASRARAIYDWIVSNVEYKKVGTGWGNGDTFWACTERYGNCTDFHSLFISLARTEGIPARFEMGFPIPAERPSGQIAGYHCWVELWLPDLGWVPVDASEASKHPEKRDLFYGTQPTDRFHMTTGRDLRLGAAHRDRPLNYFVYPYLEVDGQRGEIEVEQSFRYRELGPDEAPELGGTGQGMPGRATVATR